MSRRTHAAMSPYWQHNEPLRCPHNHVMGWLGSRFWLCMRCRTPKKIGERRGVIWVEVAEEEGAG